MPSSIQNEQLSLPIGVILSDTSLEAPQTLDDDQIIELGEKLRKIESASKWWIADYIIFVQALFSGKHRPRRDVYDRIQNIWPEYARSTLQTWASVARRIPAKLRSNSLSFEHHVHIAVLYDEKQATELQRHFIKAAEKSEATAEELRLMIADTRHGVAIAPAARRHKSEPIDVTMELAPVAANKSRFLLGSGVEIEPELMRGSHAQLCGESQRSIARLRDWYNAKARKENLSIWPSERRAVLIHDLEPLLKEMEGIAAIAESLAQPQESPA